LLNFQLVRKLNIEDKYEKYFFQDTILANAKDNDVAFLVGGDPLSATTHTDLILRAVELNIPYRIIHNASIMNAIGSCGLQVNYFEGKVN
jgi:diphthine synthase